MSIGSSIPNRLGVPEAPARSSRFELRNARRHFSRFYVARWGSGFLVRLLTRTCWAFVCRASGARLDTPTGKALCHCEIAETTKSKPEQLPGEIATLCISTIQGQLQTESECLDTHDKLQSMNYRGVPKWAFKSFNANTKLYDCRFCLKSFIHPQRLANHDAATCDSLYRSRLHKSLCIASPRAEEDRTNSVNALKENGKVHSAPEKQSNQVIAKESHLKTRTQHVVKRKRNFHGRKRSKFPRLEPQAPRKPQGQTCYRCGNHFPHREFSRHNCNPPKNPVSVRKRSSLPRKQKYGRIKKYFKTKLSDMSGGMY